MKVLIDTNIILDVLYSREPYVEDAVKVLRYCELKQVDGYISSLSVPNIVYVMRKELDREKIRQMLETIRNILNICDLRESDLMRAANEDIDDYEDAIQCVCAARIKASYIITRNLKDFKNSKITAISPSDLIKRIESSDLNNR